MNEGYICGPMTSLICYFNWSVLVQNAFAGFRVLCTVQVFRLIIWCPKFSHQLFFERNLNRTWNLIQISCAISNHSMSLSEYIVLYKLKTVIIIKTLKLKRWNIYHSIKIVLAMFRCSAAKLWFCLIDFSPLIECIFVCDLFDFDGRKL